jgi:CRP-like cAMP-binding protein
MAMLDPAPRAASATTVGPALLLRLDRAPFLELVDEYPQVAVGVIRVLARRLRARLADVAELGAELRAAKAPPSP